jgi:hypothetical protein
LTGLACRIDQCLIAGRAGQVAVGAHEAPGIERSNSLAQSVGARAAIRANSRVAVKTHGHTRRNRQAREEALVKPLAADQVNRGLRPVNRAHRKKAKRRRSIRQLFTLQKRGLCRRSRGRLRVAEPCRPLL